MGAMTVRLHARGINLRSRPRSPISHRDTRLTRSAAVQGLSRFASDIIIRGFDTPCKLGFYDGQFVAENLNSTPMPTPLPEADPNPNPKLTQVSSWRRTSTTRAS